MNLIVSQRTSGCADGNYHVKAKSMYWEIIRPALRG